MSLVFQHSGQPPLPVTGPPTLELTLAVAQQRNQLSATAEAAAFEQSQHLNPIPRGTAPVLALQCFQLGNAFLDLLGIVDPHLSLPETAAQGSTLLSRLLESELVLGEIHAALT